MSLGISIEGNDVIFAISIQGSIIARLELHCPGGVPYCWLDMLYVDSAYRGKGYGQKLTRAAIDYVRKMQCKNIFVLDESSRYKADDDSNIYYKNGFRRVAPQSNRRLLRL